MKPKLTLPAGDPWRLVLWNAALLVAAALLPFATHPEFLRILFLFTLLVGVIRMTMGLLRLGEKDSMNFEDTSGRRAPARRGAKDQAAVGAGPRCVRFGHELGRGELRARRGRAHGPVTGLQPMRDREGNR